MKQVNSQKQVRRNTRSRARLFGTKECPRIVVFRSLRYIYGQVIDDSSGKVLLAMDARGLDSKKTSKNTIATATKVGEQLGKQCAEKKINRAVFDRNGYRYHGRVKAFAEGIRKSGVQM